MATGVGKMTLQPLQMKAVGIVGIDAVLVKQIPLPEDHPFYALIGRVVAEWARLEHELDLIIWDFAQTDPAVNSCMTGQIGSYTARFEAIAALIQLRGRYDKSMNNRITTLRGQIGNSAKERARYVHDAWFIQTSGDQLGDINEVGRFSNFSVKGKKFGFLPISEEEARKFIEKIKQHTESVSKLRSDLSGKPTP